MSSPPKAAHFQIYEDGSRGAHRWRLVAANGLIIADSGEGYASKRGCEIAVDRVISIVSEIAASGVQEKDPSV